MAQQRRSSRQTGKTSSRRRSAHNGANRPDATLRNVRAANKRFDQLLAKVEELETSLAYIADRLKAGGL